MFTNYSLTLAITASLLLLGLYMGLGIVTSMSDKYESRLLLRIVAKFFRDLKYLVTKRLAIPRKKTCLMFFKQKLIVLNLVGLRLHLAKLYRKQLRLM